jgi:hypothetical protein
MSERIRRGLAFVIAIGMVIAVAAAPSVAQTIDPDAERVFEIAGLNADKVDGQHAVKYSTKKSKRANKLVATNAAGYLPSNIVKPGWGYIKHKPAGFADGVDNAGVTGIKITRVHRTMDLTQAWAGHAECPAGYVAIGGGFDASNWDVRVVESYPASATAWAVYAMPLTSEPRTVDVYAVCLTTKPDGTLTLAKRG